MIRLDLGAEPFELKKSRQERLPEAIKAFNAHGPGSGELNRILDGGYQVARPTLRYRQHNKCAFCESPEDHESRPVEHFRPKKEAHDDGTGKLVVDKTHYWWLAWTWSNLYFSCIKCNKKGNKGSRFTLMQGTTRAIAPSRPVADPIPDSHYDFSSESALLVDPRTDQPLDHLQWVPVDRRLPRASWRWTIEGLTKRGTETIRILGLTDRIDRVNSHIDAISSTAIEIDEHLAMGRNSDARKAFERLVTQYVDDCDKPFRNAAYWALDGLYPLTFRTENGFAVVCRPRVTVRSGLSV